MPPPPGGAIAPLTSTYSYLKARVRGRRAERRHTVPRWRSLPSSISHPDGLLNMEATQLSPLLLEDDDFFFHLLGGDVDPATGLIADDTPPFKLYPSTSIRPLPARSILRPGLPRSLLHLL